MACPGFNLPRGIACPALGKCMSVVGEAREAICCRCYAGSGRYRWSNVKASLIRRWEWWQATAPLARARQLQLALMNEGAPQYFRCYDSGDLDLSAGDTWISLAEAMPDTLFWIPTRTWILDEFADMLLKMSRVPNIIVRPSSMAFDDPPPIVAGLSAGTASAWLEPVKADLICAEQCGDCRVCWTEPKRSVSYKRKTKGKRHDTST